MAPSLRAAAKIGPCVVVALDLGATKAFGLRLGSHPTDEDLSVGAQAWPEFRSLRHPPG